MVRDKQRRKTIMDICVRTLPKIRFIISTNNEK